MLFDPKERRRKIVHHGLLHTKKQQYFLILTPTDRFKVKFIEIDPLHP